MTLIYNILQNHSDNVARTWISDLPAEFFESFKVCRKSRAAEGWLNFDQTAEENSGFHSWISKADWEHMLC